MFFFYVVSPYIFHSQGKYHNFPCLFLSSSYLYAIARFQFLPVKIVSILLCSAADKAFQADDLNVQVCAVLPVKSTNQFATLSIDAYVKGDADMFIGALAAVAVLRIAVEFCGTFNVVNAEQPSKMLTVRVAFANVAEDKSILTNDEQP